MLNLPKAPKAARAVNPDPALRLPDAAEYLDVSVRSIRRLIKARRLKAVRLGAQVLAIRVSELERFLADAAV